MKKILLATALMASTSAFAAVINNDVNQGTVADLQINGVADASLLSIGPTTVTGTNLVNTSTAVTVGLLAAVDNDVNQGAAFIGQGNGVLSLNGIDIGNTTVTGINSVNASTQTAAAVGPAAIVVGNDTLQGAAFILQGNGVANAALLSAGNITVDGTNLVNTAEQTIGGAGILTLTAENDIDQGAAVIGQGNGVLNAGIGTLGNISVTGINAVNSAQQNIGSLGILADGVVRNDINQGAIAVGQTNGVTDAAIFNLGNVTVDGTNLVNTAQKNTLVAGIFQGVVNNDISQTADTITQSNTVTSLGGLTVGDITVTGTNAVNVAESNVGAFAVAQVVARNDINQNATAIRQDNEILVGAVISTGAPIGTPAELTVNGTNVVNQATHTVGTLALIEGVVNNDINQLATDVVQANRIGVVAGVAVGDITVNGSNAINTASLDIDMSAFGLAARNDINQATGGAVQYNAVGSVAAVQAGPITVNGTNSINSANLNIVQSIPTP